MLSVYILVIDRLTYYCFFFFFQAEDGIRDLVRSRGLGDVYKRQVRGAGRDALGARFHEGVRGVHQGARGVDQVVEDAVSYTHLTLPTSDLV